MPHFERKASDEQGIQFVITDDYNHSALLSPQNAYDLLHWLTKQQDELYRLTYSQQQGQPNKQRLGIDTKDVAERAHEDWANDE